MSTTDIDIDKRNVMKHDITNAPSEELHDARGHSDAIPRGEEKQEEPGKQGKMRHAICSQCEDMTTCQCWAWIATNLLSLLFASIWCITCIWCNGCSNNGYSNGLRDANRTEGEDAFYGINEEDGGIVDAGDKVERDGGIVDTRNEGERDGGIVDARDRTEKDGGTIDARDEERDKAEEDVRNRTIRCTPKSCDACAPSITNLGDGTAIDWNTCLIWQLEGVQSSNVHTQTDGIGYCRGLTLTLAGRGWHLPYIRELQSIIGISITKTDGVFWSQSLTWGDPTTGYGIDFRDGSTVEIDIQEEHSVRCVR